MNKDVCAVLENPTPMIWTLVSDPDNSCFRAPDLFSNKSDEDENYDKTEPIVMKHANKLTRVVETARSAGKMPLPIRT